MSKIKPSHRELIEGALTLFKGRCGHRWVGATAGTYINFHAQVNLQTVQNLMAAISQKLMIFFDFYTRRSCDERSLRNN
jgi:hypothetical protein